MGTELAYSCCIRLERYDAHSLQGEIYQPYFGVQEFDSIMGMFMIMEQQLDHLHNLFAGSIDFSSPVPVKPEIFPACDGLSFLIDVVSRQNLTWHGMFSCPARKIHKSFKSTSELMMHLENILSKEVGNENLKSK